MGLEGLGLSVDEVDRGRRAARRRARPCSGRWRRTAARTSVAPALAWCSWPSRRRCWSSTSSGPIASLHPAQAATGAPGSCGARGSSWPTAPSGARLARRRRSAATRTLLRAPRACPRCCWRSAAAGYSAFLFGQAEGRDFWQSPLAAAAPARRGARGGRGVLLLLVHRARCRRRAAMPRALGVACRAAAVALAAVHGVLLALELLEPARRCIDVARAARLITRGALPRALLGRRGGGGHRRAARAPDRSPAPARSHVARALAALLALAGLWLWEDLWVKAGQSVPLS